MQKLLRKFDRAVKLVEADPELVLQVASYGRVWNTDNDYARLRENLQKYSYPDKVEIEAINKTDVPTLEEKIRSCFDEAEASDGKLKVLVSAYGRVWDNVGQELDYTLECCERYQYPEKIEVRCVSTEKRNPFELLQRLTNTPHFDDTASKRQIWAEIKYIKAKREFERLL